MLVFNILRSKLGQEMIFCQIWLVHVTVITRSLIQNHKLLTQSLDEKASLSVTSWANNFLTCSLRYLWPCVCLSVFSRQTMCQAGEDRVTSLGFDWCPQNSVHLTTGEDQCRTLKMATSWNVFNQHPLCKHLKHLLRLQNFDWQVFSLAVTKKFNVRREREVWCVPVAREERDYPVLTEYCDGHHHHHLPALGCLVTQLSRPQPCLLPGHLTFLLPSFCSFILPVYCSNAAAGEINVGLALALSGVLE